MSEKCPELFQVLFSAIGRLLSLDVMGKNIHFMFLFLLKYVLAIVSITINKGNKISMESKLATISTIYGMILHCHNVKACAVQRIFTALCIRYHADNKVFICSAAYVLIMAYSAAI